MSSLKITVPICTDDPVPDINAMEFADSLIRWLVRFSQMPKCQYEVSTYVEKKLKELSHLRVSCQLEVYVNPSQLGRPSSPYLLPETNTSSRDLGPSRSRPGELFVPDNRALTAREDSPTRVSNESSETALQSQMNPFVQKALDGCIKPNLLQFIQSDIENWTKRGLWLTSPNSAGWSTDLAENCSTEMSHAGVDNPWGSKRVVRRLARVRLVYWFEQECKNVKSPRQATERVLQSFYNDWNDAVDKKSRRQKFHTEKAIGKKWCQLANWLDPGILVIGGDEMDAEISKTTFNDKLLNALAVEMLNDKRPIIDYCRLFEPLAKCFIRKETFSGDQYNDWFQKAVTGCERYAPDPNRTRVEALEPTKELTSFIGKYLNTDV